MRDSVLWRKVSNIVIMLADRLEIDEKRALDIFYSTKTYRLLSDPKSGIQLMSDEYILEDILNEILNNKPRKCATL